MATPASSATAYASPADWVKRTDSRTLGQLASFTGVALLPSQLATSEVLLEVLKDASGLVEAAVCVGAAYKIDSTTNDLADLTGVGQAFLKRLVCDLALGMLWLARPDREGEVPKSYMLALETLNDVREGRKVFGLIEHKQAGNLDSSTESAADVESRNGIVFECQRLFGTRNNRLHG